MGFLDLLGLWGFWGFGGFGILGVLGILGICAYSVAYGEWAVRCGWGGAGGRGAGYSWEVMRKHYEVCVADYVRFMAGWGFW